MNFMAGRILQQYSLAFENILTRAIAKVGETLYTVKQRLSLNPPDVEIFPLHLI